MFEKLSSQEALKRLARDRVDFARFIERETFDVGLYRPDGIDTQTPHARDEVYVIANGSGAFVCGNERVTFAPGDMLFVPAGDVHRFENFTSDFCAWVIFFGKRA